jgi:aminomethyltransferase
VHQLHGSSLGDLTAAGVKSGELPVPASLRRVESSATLKRTSLYDEHVAAGARLVPFAGWEMPVQYEGVGPEHMAVRERAGVFDVSHMGQIGTSGPDSLAFLQRLVSNDIAKLAPGGAQYSCLCADDGGILDDLFSYLVEADVDYLTVSNASNHEIDLARFQEIAEGFDVEIADLAPFNAMLAVQGPEARGIVAGLSSAELPARMKTARLEVAGAEALVCGTGYTGEDGVEILLAPEAAPHLWRELLAAGVTPCGLGARDTLRLEVCFHLHGNDMGPDRNPIEAGLGWCCKEETGFAGGEPIAAARADGTAEKLVAFAVDGKGIPRAGNAILTGGEPAGDVRSELAEPGQRIEIDVRGRVRDAEIRPKPLYAKS